MLEGKTDIIGSIENIVTILESTSALYIQFPEVDKCTVTMYLGIKGHYVCNFCTNDSNERENNKAY